MSVSVCSATVTTTLRNQACLKADAEGLRLPAAMLAALTSEAGEFWVCEAEEGGLRLLPWRAFVAQRQALFQQWYPLSQPHVAELAAALRAPDGGRVDI